MSVGEECKKEGEVCVGGCGEGVERVGVGGVGAGGGGLTDLALFLLWCNCLTRYFPPFFYISSFLFKFS